MKATTLIGGLPAHNFALADNVSPLGKRKALEDYFIPNSVKTKELLKAFDKRGEFYSESMEAADGKKLFQKIVGNNDWITWTQNANLLSSLSGTQYYKDELGIFEKAVYGALCGNQPALLEMAETWHDRLWASLKGFFGPTVLKEFISERPNYAILFGGSFNPVAVHSSIPFGFSDILSASTTSVFLFPLSRFFFFSKK